jgi:hypothetical protein
LTPDVTIDNVEVDLKEGAKGILFLPLIRRLKVRVTNGALKKFLCVLLTSNADRLPVKIDIEDTSFRGNEAEISLVMKKWVNLRGTIVLRIDDLNGEQVLLEVSRINVLKGMGEKILIPVIESLITNFTKYPGVATVAGRPRAISISPDALLKGLNVPVSLAPGGRWFVTCASDLLTLEYSS